MTSSLRERALDIDALGSSIASGGHALNNVPVLLKRVLDEGSWREFITKRGEHVRHERFEDFVTESPLAGLGSDLETVYRLVANDNRLTSAIDMAEQRPGGRPSKGTVDNVNSRPDGNARQQALRRLRKDRPDLHAEVLADNLSAHAAMVAAGFRPKTATIRLDDPERLAQSLIRKLEPDDLETLTKFLMEALNAPD